ncbi:MAG: subclass B1 metallo-beta-lactamase [Bacteroidota bacterium]
MNRVFYLTFLVLLPFCLNAQERIKLSEDLSLVKLNERTYIHVSKLQTKSFGKVACNGLLYVVDGQAMLFDTPADEPQTKLLLGWIETNLEASLTAVVATHFHVDCLGGLESVHQAGIPSFGFRKTIRLATKREARQPQQSFGKQKIWQLGGREIEVRHFGPGHTVDNVVVWLKQEQILFGGCLIKAKGAGKGNLADAKPKKWSATVRKVRSAYSGAQTVIPGHGQHGDLELLNFTIDLFSNKNQGFVTAYFGKFR